MNSCSYVGTSVLRLDDQALKESRLFVLRVYELLGGVWFGVNFVTTQAVIILLLTVDLDVLKLVQLCLKLLQLHIHFNDFLIPLSLHFGLFIELLVDCSLHLSRVGIYPILSAVALCNLSAPVPVEVHPKCEEHGPAQDL